MNIRSLTLTLIMVLLAFGSVTAAVGIPPVNAPATPAATEAAALEAARAYRESLKELSGKERRTLRRQQMKEAKAALSAHQDPDTGDVFLILLAIFLPPVAVLVYEGELNNRFWIALLLTLLLLLPGIIYALLVITGNI